MQNAPGPSCAPHVVPTKEKMEEFVIPIPQPEQLSVSTAAPVLVKVAMSGALVDPTVCGPKARGFGVNDAVVGVPTPLMGTHCGEPTALSLKHREPVTVPDCVGWNPIRTVQDTPGDREPGIVQVPPL